MQRPNSSFTRKTGISSYMSKESDTFLGSPGQNIKNRTSESARSTKTSIKAFFGLITFFFFLWILFPSHKGLFKDKSDVSSYKLDINDEFDFTIVADLDRMSKDLTSSKPRWRSILKFGKIFFDNSSNRWKIGFDPSKTFDIYSHLGEAGRGMELSELLFVNDELLAFDDRSGTVFEIKSDKSLLSSYDISSTSNFECIPRYIITEGDGNSAKGQKTEWATSKDGELYIGSFGKEFTQEDGSIAHYKNLWVTIINSNNEIRHSDWTDIYNALREATGTQHPGYMIHEAINFNQYRREWVILPRRVSKDRYDEKLDELKGSNLIITADEDFSNIRIQTVGEIVPEKGFSSFKFLPNTNGKVIVALKTIEKEDKITGESEQTSFITMFDLTGKILIEDIEIEGEAKFEGLEFL